MKKFWRWLLGARTKQCGTNDAIIAIAFADWILENDYEKIHGNRWCRKYTSVTYSSSELYKMWFSN